MSFYLSGISLRKQKLDGFTGKFEFDKNGERRGDQHFIYRTFKDQFQNWGSYNNETGLSLQTSETFMKKNKDSDKIMLTVTTIIAAPYRVVL